VQTRREHRAYPQRSVRCEPRRRHGKEPPNTLGGGKKFRWQDDAGILALGEARRRSISPAICD
jgi:hypothetical protein